MSPPPAAARRAPGAFLGGTALVLSLLPAAFDAARAAGANPRPQGDPGSTLADTVRRIQNVCFAAYPDDLVARMSGIDGPAPTDIRDDPRAQIRYLRREDTVDKGLFFPSLLDDMVPALRAVIRPGTRLLDLGSGDGRVVFLAAVLGAEATGIEYDKGLHAVALRARDALADLVDPRRAVLRRGDFFREDWGRYDVLFYYASGSFGENRIEEKVMAGLGPDARLLLAEAPKEIFPNLDLDSSFGPVQIFRRRAPRAGS